MAASKTQQVNKSSTYINTKERRALVAKLMLKGTNLADIHQYVNDVGFNAKIDTVRKDIDLAQAEVRKLKEATPVPTMQQLQQQAIKEYQRLQNLAEMKGDIKTAITALDRINSLQGVTVSTKTQTVNQTINNTQINTVTSDNLNMIPLELRKSLLDAMKNNNKQIGQ